MSDQNSYIPDASFSALVLTLSSSAWVSLGKIADPISGEVRQDLRSAKFSIDTLLMLRSKTSGNLSDDERKLLDASINDLQANYAETVFSGKDTRKAEEGGDASSGVQAQGEGDGTETAEEKTGEKATNSGPAGKKTDQ